MDNSLRALACSVVLLAIQDYKKLQKNNKLSCEEKLKEEKAYIEFFDSINKMEWYYFIRKKYRCIKCAYYKDYECSNIEICEQKKDG